MRDTKKVIMELDRNLCLSFGIYAKNEGIVNQVNWIGNALDWLMDSFSEGKFDDILTEKDKITENKKRVTVRKWVTRSIKFRFNDVAFAKGFVKSQNRNTQLLELLMRKFIDGEIKLEDYA